MQGRRQPHVGRGSDETAQRQVRRKILSKWSGLLAGVMAVAAVSGVIALVTPRIHATYLLVLYVLAVTAVATVWGTGLAVFAAVLSIVVFTYLFVHPFLSFRVDDPSDTVGSAVFLATAVVVGRLAVRLRRAAHGVGTPFDGAVALRRIATLVAQSSPPSAVFEAVTREVGLLCGADLARMEHYEEDGTVIGVAAWSRVPGQLAVGERFSLVGPSIAREVRETGRPVRVASFAGATGAIAHEARGCRYPLVDRLPDHRGRKPVGGDRGLDEERRTLPGEHGITDRELHRAGRYCRRERGQP